MRSGARRCGRNWKARGRSSPAKFDWRGEAWRGEVRLALDGFSNLEESRCASRTSQLRENLLHDGGVGAIQPFGELRAAFVGEEATEDGDESTPITGFPDFL